MQYALHFLRFDHEKKNDSCDFLRVWLTSTRNHFSVTTEGN